MKRIKISTKNKEVYNKFILLNFNPEVIINGVENKYINKILNNINRETEYLTSEILGTNSIKLTKLKHFKFDIYLK